MYTLFLLPLLFHFAGALLNVTVDDTDSSIIYEGAWDPLAGHQSGLNYGGSHRLSTNPAANATFSFSGIAIYYVASRWPYAVSTQLSLDGGPGVTVNLTDPVATPSLGGSESAMFSVAWSATGLANTSHTLFLSMPHGGQFIVVDGFIYTVNNGSAAAPSSSASAETPVTTSEKLAGDASAHSRTRTIEIALGIPLGIVVLIGATAFVLYYHRRRRAARHGVLQPMRFNSWGAGSGAVRPVTPLFPLSLPVETDITPFENDVTPIARTPLSGKRASHAPPGLRPVLPDETIVTVEAVPATIYGEQATTHEEDLHAPVPPAYSECATGIDARPTP